MSRFADWFWRAAFAGCALFLCGIPVVLLTYKMQPVAAGLCLAISSMLLLLFAILVPLERMTKGLFLVCLAVLSSLLYSLTVGPTFALLQADNGTIVSSTGKYIASKEFFSTGAIGEWLLTKIDRTQVDFFTQAGKLFDSLMLFVNLACAGAGGSLIAVEADRRSKVIKIAEHPSSGPASTPDPTVTPDSSPLIRSLAAKMDNQAEALGSLKTHISNIDLRISTLIAQQARFGRKLVIAGIIGAAVLGFVIGGLVFANI